MPHIKISPSIMCCKTEEFKPYIEKFEKVHLDSIHFDVMDGHFVRNIMLGVTSYQDLKRLTKLPVDLHLMCTDPERFIDIFKVQAGDRVSFHPETTWQPYRLLQQIHELGCKAGLVINPGTSLDCVSECADQLDYVTIMTVNPGFAGQKMVPNALEKIHKVHSLLNEAGREDVDIVVDGNTTYENSRKMRDAGANAFVAGTSSILNDLSGFEHNYQAYKYNLEEVKE